VNLDATKTELLFVLARKIDSEDLSGFMGLDPQRFERMVHFVEDLDPYWLAKQLRDANYSLGVRVEIAGLMRGRLANGLLLELLA
jgi:hypothetical protein